MSKKMKKRIRKMRRMTAFVLSVMLFVGICSYAGVALAAEWNTLRINVVGEAVDVSGLDTTAPVTTVDNQGSSVTVVEPITTEGSQENGYTKTDGGQTTSVSNIDTTTMDQTYVDGPDDAEIDTQVPNTSVQKEEGLSNNDVEQLAKDNVVTENRTDDNVYVDTKPETSGAAATDKESFYKEDGTAKDPNAPTGFPTGSDVTEDANKADTAVIATLEMQKAAETDATKQAALQTQIDSIKSRPAKQAELTALQAELAALTDEAAKTAKQGEIDAKQKELDAIAEYLVKFDGIKIGTEKSAEKTTVSVDGGAEQEAIKVTMTAEGFGKTDIFSVTEEGEFIVSTEKKNIILTIDVSGSMGDQVDGDPAKTSDESRWDVLRQAVTAFVANIYGAVDEDGNVKYKQGSDGKPTNELDIPDDVLADPKSADITLIMYGGNQHYNDQLTDVVKNLGTFKATGAKDLLQYFSGEYTRTGNWFIADDGKDGTTNPAIYTSTNNDAGYYETLRAIEGFIGKNVDPKNISVVYMTDGAANSYVDEDYTGKAFKEYNKKDEPTFEDVSNIPANIASNNDQTTAKQKAADRAVAILATGVSLFNVVITEDGTTDEFKAGIGQYFDPNSDYEELVPAETKWVEDANGTHILYKNKQYPILTADDGSKYIERKGQRYTVNETTGEVSRVETWDEPVPNTEPVADESITIVPEKVTKVEYKGKEYDVTDNKFTETERYKIIPKLTPAGWTYRVNGVEVTLHQDPQDNSKWTVEFPNGTELPTEMERTGRYVSVPIPEKVHTVDVTYGKGNDSAKINQVRIDVEGENLNKNDYEKSSKQTNFTFEGATYAAINNGTIKGSDGTEYTIIVGKGGTISLRYITTTQKSRTIVLENTQKGKDVTTPARTLGGYLKEKIEKNNALANGGNANYSPINMENVKFTAADTKDKIIEAYKTIGHKIAQQVADKSLIAYNAKVIDVVPSEFTVYVDPANANKITCAGKDKEGNTIIVWNIGDITSVDNGANAKEASYFLLPAANGNLSGEFQYGTVYTNDSAILYCKPIDQGGKEVAIVMDRPVVTVEALAKDNIVTDAFVYEQDQAGLAPEKIVNIDLLNNDSTTQNKLQAIGTEVSDTYISAIKDGVSAKLTTRTLDATGNVTVAAKELTPSAVTEKGTGDEAYFEFTLTEDADSSVAGSVDKELGKVQVNKKTGIVKFVNSQAGLEQTKSIQIDFGYKLTFTAKLVDAAYVAAGDARNNTAKVEEISTDAVASFLLVGTTLPTDPDPDPDPDPVPPGGGDDPVPPGGGDDPVPPAGGDDPVPPAGGDDPVPPAGGDDPDPIVPAGTTETIEPDAIPLGGGEKTVTIPTEATPLAGVRPAWALLNLILTIGTCLASAAMLIGYAGKRAKKDEAEVEIREVKKHGLTRLLSIVPGVGAVIAFLLTENMRLPMVFTDQWTLLMAAISVIQLGVVFVGLKREKDIKPEEAKVSE